MGTHSRKKKTIELMKEKNDN